MPRILAALLLASLCACDRAPETYPPPEQHHPIDGPNPGETSMVIDLGESDAPSHFVKDIEDGSGAWRWTGQHPTLKTLVFNKEHLNLSADFTLWDAALKQTGPLQISFFVNDHLLGQARYAEAGYQHFEKPVPEDLIILDAENSVAMSVDKMYTAPEDGKKFGIILTRIGFEQK